MSDEINVPLVAQGWNIHTAGGDSVLTTFRAHTTGEEYDLLARRIVACVNRLSEFTTEDIEDPTADLFGVTYWQKRATAAEQKSVAAQLLANELFSGLRLFHNVWESLHPHMPIDHAQRLLGDVYKSTKQITAKREPKP